MNAIEAVIVHDAPREHLRPEDILNASIRNKDHDRTLNPANHALIPGGDDRLRFLGEKASTILGSGSREEQEYPKPDEIPTLEEPSQPTNMYNPKPEEPSGTPITIGDINRVRREYNLR